MAQIYQSQIFWGQVTVSLELFHAVRMQIATALATQIHMPPPGVPAEILIFFTPKPSPAHRLVIPRMI